MFWEDRSYLASLNCDRASSSESLQRKGCELFLSTCQTCQLLVGASVMEGNGKNLALW